jgi:hypothetical protein
LPTALPAKAKKVRIIYMAEARTPYFVKMWSVADGVTHSHWIYATVHLQSAELVFPIDETNRKIFADLSLHLACNNSKVSVYLTSYFE